ncbi:MAG: DNA mismatch repair protein MutS [Dehalococcoidia bacterium]|nr:DNA mismatch repair protein MutS [Dehalococcoidia bacterium]
MTPIRRQYLRIKKSYPEAIVFFRLGDFYETFDEDAKLASRELDIVLTSREVGKGQRVPMAGIPYHALDNYLARLIGKGYKVAICEQLSQPDGKSLVERDVVRVVTPGTVVEPNLLQTKANNYLVSVVLEGEGAGIAYVDITTSEFAATQLASARALPELERLRPSELLVAQGAEIPQSWQQLAPVTPQGQEWSDLATARDTLLEHFGAGSLEGYGCSNLPLAVRAAGAILHYLSVTQKGALGQITRLSTYSADSFMVLDAVTRRTLELFQSSRPGASGGTLLSVIDLTRTPMGGRLLTKWLGQPLLDVEELERRLDAVEWFFSSGTRRAAVAGLLGQTGDLERLINRVRGGIATPREMVTLRRSLEQAPGIKNVLEEDSGLSSLASAVKPLPEVVALISESIVDEPSAGLGEGYVIRRGFSPELDEVISASANAKQYLADLERSERERTGIKSLKVGYNRVFGYYLEVTTPHLSQAPSDYIRKQTLTNGERFYTPQLKEYESLILNAQERIAELEGAVFRQVCQQVGMSAEGILGVASALARVDVFFALAEVAARYGYVRPRLTEGDTVEIKAGRHPVVERILDMETFVPNDTYLSNHDCQLVVLTGPNMSGKSTYLRQVALVVLLAQTGSFVPADSATVGLVDRIFTRVGLQDDLVSGQSTFMVEMVETANILNNATPRSLVILDEIGRGTSTYDGLAIARAVAEHIHNHPQLGAKTLFATHYHELVGLAGVLPRVKNFSIAVTEEGGKVVFLRKIIPGGADKSYGIHVAQLAGLPRSVVHRAQQVLTELETDHAGAVHKKKGADASKETSQKDLSQLWLFGKKPELLEELAQLDVSSMTPLEAITKLYELQERARKL